MELERLIEFVNGHLAEGRDLDEAIAEVVEWMGCSPEQTAQLREHFVPPAVPDNVLPTPSDPVIHEPAPSMKLPERFVPVLQIDWGTELKPGRNLLPKFTIKGCQRPLLYLKIPQIGLRQVPELAQIVPDWYFYQPLRLDEPGQYLCQIIAIDQTPGFDDPGHYHADFCIDVAAPKEAGQRRKVTIHADENLTANLDRFGKDADIEIIGKNVALMARDESLVDRLADANKIPEPSGISDSTTTVPFLSNDEQAKRVPYLSQRADAQKRVCRFCSQGVFNSPAATKPTVGATVAFVGRMRLSFLFSLNGRTSFPLS